MFTIKIIRRRDDKTGCDSACSYSAASYRLDRFPDRCEVAFDFADGNSFSDTIGGPEYRAAIERGECPPQQVYITNIDGRTVDSWKMHDAS